VDEQDRYGIWYDGERFLATDGAVLVGIDLDGFPAMARTHRIRFVAPECMAKADFIDIQDTTGLHAVRSDRGVPYLVEVYEAPNFPDVLKARNRLSDGSKYIRLSIPLLRRIFEAADLLDRTMIDIKIQAPLEPVEIRVDSSWSFCVAMPCDPDLLGRRS